jgi:hypothetical protein
MKKHRVCIPKGAFVKRREAPFGKWTQRSGGNWVGHRLEKTVCGHVDNIARFAVSSHQQYRKSPKTAVHLIVRVGVWPKSWLYAIPRTGAGRATKQVRRKR